MTIRNKAYRQSSQVKAGILARDNHTCQICGCQVGQVCNLHYAPVSQMDAAHIIPWAESHDSTLANLHAVCHPCNMREAHHTERQPVYAI